MELGSLKRGVTIKTEKPVHYVLGYKSAIKEIEKNYIYELCHMPYYPPDGKPPKGFYRRGKGYVSYFSTAEIKRVIREGRMRRYSEDGVFLFVACTFLGIVRRDIEEENAKIMVLFPEVDLRENLHSTITGLLKDYSAYLTDEIHDLYELPKCKIVRT